MRKDADGIGVAGVFPGIADGVEVVGDDPVGDDSVGGTDDARDLRRVSISSENIWLCS